MLLLLKENHQKMDYRVLNGKKTLKSTRQKRFLKLCEDGVIDKIWHEIKEGNHILKSMNFLETTQV